MMDNRITFSFSEVDAILASMNFIAEHRRAAFTARVKQLLKHDILEAVAPGRGKAGTYTVVNLLQLVIAVELLQSGMAPPLAAAAVKKNRTRLEQALVREGSHLDWFYKATDAERRAYVEDDLFMILTPESLRDLVAEGDRPEPEYIHLLPSRLLDRDAIRGMRYKEASWRRLIINISDVIRAIDETACGRFKFVASEAFAADAIADAEEVYRIALESHEVVLATLSQQQIADLGEFPTREPVFGNSSAPPGTITMSEWAEAGKAVAAKNKPLIGRLVKSLRARDIPSIYSVATKHAGLGLFRLDGSKLMLTRLGKAVVTAENYAGLELYKDESGDVDPEA